MAMWGTVARLIMVPLGFVLAGIAGLFVIMTLGLERLTQALHGVRDTDAVTTIFDFLLQAHLLLTGLTIVPALLLVIVGEVARIRSSIYYILGGGAALAAIPLLSRLAQSGAGLEAMPNIVWQVFATAGFVAGWVYWFVAGRKA
jgi:hypothetical protein